MRLALVLVLLSIVWAGSSLAQDVPDVETVVFRLDYLTRTPERVYTSSDPYRGVLPESSEHTELRLHVERVPALDFGYTEVTHALTGGRVFRASTIWSGAGSFEFPAGGSSSFGDAGPSVQEQAFSFTSAFGGSEADARAAWNEVATTQPARDLADAGPVEVVVFDHFYTLGVENPETAEWIVVAYTRPPAPRDLAVVELDWPGELVTAEQPFVPEVRLHNFGDAADGGRLVLEVDGAPAAELAVGDLPQGETVRVMLPELSLQTGATLSARLVPNAAGDGLDAYPGNNVRSRAVTVTPLPVFRPISSLVEGGPVPLRGVTLDADGDGDLDVVQFASISRLALWTQDADGSFAITSDLDGLTRPYPRDVLGRDFTGDGRPDLLFIYWAQPPILLARGADGSYTDATEAAGLAAVWVEGGGGTADLDGDGMPDLVLNVGGQRQPRVFLNDGAGGFAQGEALPGSGDGTSPAFADLDGDGDLDVIVPRWYAPSSVYENLGDGALAPRPGPWPGDANRHALPFDYDGDGDADLLFSRVGGFDSVLLRNDGNFQFSIVENSGLEQPSFQAEAGDVDGDGRLDVVKDYIDRAALWVQTETGFQDRSDLLLRQDEVTRFGSVGTSPHFQFLDLDGDGDLDLYSLTVYFENQGAPGLDLAADAPGETSPLRLTVSPNPATATASVRLQLANPSHVRLDVLDALGRRVQTVGDARYPAGEAHFSLALDGLAPGVYFVQVATGLRTEAASFTVIR